MEIKKPAVAGTLESSDCQIVIRPNGGEGIEIELESDVAVMFGDSIRKRSIIHWKNSVSGRLRGDPRQGRSRLCHQGKNGMCHLPRRGEKYDWTRRMRDNG